MCAMTDITRSYRIRRGDMPVRSKTLPSVRFAANSPISASGSARASDNLPVVMTGTRAWMREVHAQKKFFEQVLAGEARKEHRNRACLEQTRSR